MEINLTIEGVCEATTVPVKFSGWDILQELNAVRQVYQTNRVQSAGDRTVFGFM